MGERSQCTVYELFKANLAAMRGARDAFDNIPEGRRGNHDSTIARQLRRLDESIEKTAAAIDAYDKARGAAPCK